MSKYTPIVTIGIHKGIVHEYCRMCKKTFKAKIGTMRKSERKGCVLKGLGRCINYYIKSGVEADHLEAAP